MTKSTITREESVQAVFDLKVGYRIEFADLEILKRVARMALAAMDSEPVFILEVARADYKGQKLGNHFGFITLDAARELKEGNYQLYAAQPAPVVPVVPDVMEPTIEAIKRILPTSNPDEYAACIGADMWNACRAAMLQAGSDEIGSWGNGKHPPSDKPSPIDHGYLPECECSGCKATARTCTEMAVNSLVIPNEMTSEQAYEIGYYYGDPVDVFARGANWMRQHIIDSTLAAAPQSPGSEPATVPGKWIPVSERMPEDEQEVLTINKMGHRFVSFFDKHSGLFFDRLDAPAACCIEHVLVTHWMQLPAGPREVKGE